MRSNLFLGLALSISGTAVHAATFTVLGTLEPFHSSYGYAVSANGAVGGIDERDGREAFRWTQSQGMQGLGHLEPVEYYPVSSANGISADGETVIGSSYSNPIAMRWTATDGMQSLGSLPSHYFSEAFGVSADGSVIVGMSYDGQGPSQAFRWTSDGGMTGLGNIASGTFSHAYAVSADGTVIVGAAGSSETQPFRWENGVMEGLGFLPGGTRSAAAYGVSADGSTIVGQAADAYSFEQPFRWTAASGMVDLGRLGECHSGRAYGVSGDGGIVVGGTVCDQAFLWTESDGMQDLKNVLIGRGATGIEGWYLREARAISADGRWVVGYAIDNNFSRQAFLADLSPVPVPAVGWILGPILAIFGWRRRPRTTSA